jgi:hypothetical protein
MCAVGQGKVNCTKGKNMQQSRHRASNALLCVDNRLLGTLITILGPLMVNCRLDKKTTSLHPTSSVDNPNSADIKA